MHFLDRFFAQLDTQILEKQEKHPLFKMFAGTNKREMLMKVWMDARI